MTETRICDNISEMRNMGQKRLGKYTRNYRRYSYTPYISLTNERNPNVIGWFQGDMDVGQEDDTQPTPAINVIKSVIDTLTSKIAQSKVRPFFNCINGTFKDIMIVKQAQQYFDQFFDFQNVNKKVSEAFRDSCIFDTGIIYIDEDNARIERALPWQVFIRPSEMNYGKITRVYYERKDYPTTLLDGEIFKDAKKALEQYEYVTLGIYYDTVNKVKAYKIDEISFFKSVDYEGTEVPFCFLHYNSPIHGDSSESVVDMLNSIQIQIDTIMARVSDASQLTPSSMFFVPEGSSVKISQISNRAGQIMYYRPTPSMTGSPISTFTPNFISSQYMQYVDELKQTAYELVGISQLSAMSAKPTGLDSGVSLQTMENIESDRFETQLNQVIRCYVDIAKKCIDSFPKNKDILPEEKTRESIKWADIVREKEKMTIQFSGADALSKDPSEKLKQLQLLAQSGVIPQSRIAQFIEIPDLQSGYSLTNNAINAVLSTIERCINDDVFDIPEFIPFQMLKEEIINTQLSLTSAGYKRNKEDIEKLNKLYATAEDMEQKWTMDAQAEQQAQAMAEQGVAQNVLTQEAQMTQAPQAVEGNLDMSADGAQMGNWNA